MKRNNTFKAYQYLFFSCCLLLSCPIFGQARQVVKNSAGFGKEGKVLINELSADGKWISYGISYESGTDTLVLQNTVTKARQLFPKGTQSHFGGKRFFACIRKNDLIVLSLESGRSFVVPNISRYFFLANGTCLATLNTKHILELRNTRNKVVQTIEGITGFELNETRDVLLYSSNTKDNFEVGILGANFSKNRILATTKEAITKLMWREDSKAVAFISGGNLEYVNLETQKSFKLSAAKLLEQGKVISSNPIYPVALSADGKKVFVGLALAEKRSLLKGPEVWNGNDRMLYPVQQSTAASGVPVIGVWFPESGSFRVLNDEARYCVRLSGLNDYVVVSDPFSYGLEPSYPELVDYYIKNVHTGAEKLLLKKQRQDTTMLCFSPLTNSIAYYSEGQWWLYNPETDETICLTSSVHTKWDNSDIDAPISVSVYGLAGWSADGKSVFLYDKYDIWKVALAGGYCTNMTKGSEWYKRYRLDKSATANLKFRPYNSEKRLIISEQQDLLLTVESENDWSTGYAIYRSGKGLQSIDYGAHYCSNLHKSETNDLAYLTETYAKAPQLVYVKAREVKPKLLYSSPMPKQPVKKAELISYTNSKGTTLKSALFYPDGYDAGIQYPMIVVIYEKKSKAIHRYSSQTLLSSDGSVVANFTAAGYFVLFPDFELEIGKPGLSATDCVTAAVMAALSKASINPKKVGLMGHSYGGYETNFIITQTDIFAAAVSGAGISNTISRYFGLAFNLTNTDLFRYENQQWRMGASFFDAKQGYWDNSPIMHADHVKTPILLWHGKLDDTIPFDQCVSFYLALRRLGRQTIMVAYPDEGHDLSKPENQEDLTSRIIQWFDYFLKDNANIGWISNGILPE
ncbi:S9 family peptidase [Flavobacterium silvisoli]|uniref:S9 family peptidase n=1 Tax=Flavobacterium silvisoli TaxID=2529433 RepID=A0A4Q9YXD5_9FLAO|nr:prolyl oligopeptidase family serine peptidase [Flavobacterium silvisoli]TBX67490.1 S9 family peptidase [Flavobacterium silvisoli]